ncbi:MAG: Na+/H+ antiporter [Nocardioidaceae bacterium]
MEAAIWLVSLASTVVLVSAVCRRFDLSAPIVLVVVGIGASYLPFVPQVHLSSEVVLIGLLPPLLYSAARQTSLIDFNANRRPILLLSVGLVVFTTLGVGFVVHAVIPGLPWPAAFVIGAVVAPPDAVAATAIAKRIGMPRRIVTILEGESLLNDATALVAFGTAVAASQGGVTAVEVGVDFFVAAVGGVSVGLLVFVVVGWVRKHLTAPVLDTSVSLITPFVAYVLAEEIHASGVLAVVVAGLALGHLAPVMQTATSRIAEGLNWATISFLLENAVFLLIGLQARWIVEAVGNSDLSTPTIVSGCVATLVAVIALRLIWVFPARFLLVRPGSGSRRPPSSYTFVLGWAGMRGVVTLAVAFAIPLSMSERDVLVLIALVVTAGTLLIQGLSLPWLVRVLRLPGPDSRGDAIARAGLYQRAGQAGLAWLEEHPEDDPHEITEMIRQRVEQRDFAAWERIGIQSDSAETPSEAYARLRLGMLQAERARVLEIRSQGVIPHEVVSEVLRSLDVEESMLDFGVRRGEEAREDVTARGHEAELCIHLTEFRRVPAPEDLPRECVDCVAAGTRWVHLRVCLVCGGVRCSDSSPERHATAHFHATRHPVVQSAEPDESWRWCFVDEIVQQ